MFVVYSLVWHVVVQKVAVEQTAKITAGGNESVPQVMTQLPHAGDLSATVVYN